MNAETIILGATVAGAGVLAAVGGTLLSRLVTEQHSYDPERDRCTCGAFVVYWSGPGWYGEGCEQAGPWTTNTSEENSR